MTSRLPALRGGPRDLESNEPGHGRRSRPAVALLLLLLAVMAHPVGAQGGGAHVEMGLGWFDVAAADGGTAALEAGVRTPPLLWRLRARAGSVISARGAGYGYGALELPLPLHRRVELPLSLGAGGYWRGEGVDLGSRIAFRSSIGLGYRVHRGGRLVLQLYHLSNAGIADRNPGLEVLGLHYALEW